MKICVQGTKLKSVCPEVCGNPNHSFAKEHQTAPPVAPADIQSSVLLCHQGRNSDCFNFHPFTIQRV